jgi:hypothetical protein
MVAREFDDRQSTIDFVTLPVATGRSKEGLS